MNRPVVSQYASVEERSLLIGKGRCAIWRANLGHDDVVEVDAVQHLGNRFFEQRKERIACFLSRYRFIVLVVAVILALLQPAGLGLRTLLVVAAYQLVFAIVDVKALLPRFARRT